MSSDKITATYKRRRSSAIVQTNPRLTGNIKIVTDSRDVYIELIPSNDRLQTRQYTTRPVNININEFSQDVYNMLSEIPQETLFAVEDIQIEQQITRLSEQKPTLYSYGVRPCTSRYHNEQFRAFAPLYISERLPRYFVVFTLDGLEKHITDVKDLIDNTAYIVIDGSVTEKLINGVIKEQTTYRRGDTFVYKHDNRTYELSTNIRLVPALFDHTAYLEQARILTVFDLHRSKLGTYLQKLINNEHFGLPPVEVDFKAKHITYNGISTRRGGFVSATETLDEFYRREYPVFEFDRHVTDGFARNGLIMPQILNLEFLFDDDRHDDFTFNRYFGLYCDDTLGKINFEVTDLDKIRYPDKAPGLAYVKNLTTGKFSSVYKDTNDPTTAIVDKREVIDVTPLPDTTIVGNGFESAILPNVFRKPNDKPIQEVLTERPFIITVMDGTTGGNRIATVMGKNTEWLIQQGLLGNETEASSRDLLKYGCWKTSPNEAVFHVVENEERTYKNLINAINAVYEYAHFDFVYDEHTLLVYTGLITKNVIITNEAMSSTYELKTMTVASPTNAEYRPTTNDRRGFWIKSVDEQLLETVKTNDPLNDRGTWLLGEHRQLTPVRYKTFGVEPRQFKLHNNSRRCLNLDDLLTSHVGIYTDFSPDTDIPKIEPKVHLFRRPVFEFGFFDLCPIQAFDVNIQQPYVDTLWNEYFFYYNTQPDQLIDGECYAVFYDEPYTIEIYDTDGNRIETWSSNIANTQVDFYVVNAHGKSIDRYRITRGHPSIILKKFVYDDELVYYSGLFNQINRNYSQSTIIINHNVNLDRSIYTVKTETTPVQNVPYKVKDADVPGRRVHFLVRNTSKKEQSLITKYHWRFQEISKTDGINEYSRFNDIERARRYLLYQSVNKWVMAERSAKENPIRLSLSSRHGETAELPTLEYYSANSLYSSLEWFALSRFPAVYPKDKIESSKHYFEADFDHQQHIVPDDDYFTRYFTVYRQKGMDVKFQERFSRFKEVCRNTYQVTHRGVRYEIYDEHRSYDDYRFATILNRRKLDDIDAYREAVGRITQKLDEIGDETTGTYKATASQISLYENKLKIEQQKLSAAGLSPEDKAAITQEIYRLESIVVQLEYRLLAFKHETACLKRIQHRIASGEITSLETLIYALYDSADVYGRQLAANASDIQRLRRIAFEKAESGTASADDEQFYADVRFKHIVESSSWHAYIDIFSSMSGLVDGYTKNIDKKKVIIAKAKKDISTWQTIIDESLRELENIPMTASNAARITELQNKIREADSKLVALSDKIKTNEGIIAVALKEIDQCRHNLDMAQTMFQTLTDSATSEIQSVMDGLDVDIAYHEATLQRLCYQISINDKYKTICLSINVDLKDYKTYIEAVLSDKAIVDLQHNIWKLRDNIAKYVLEDGKTVEETFNHEALMVEWKRLQDKKASGGTLTPKEAGLLNVLDELKDHVDRVTALKHKSARHTLDYVYLYAMDSIKEYNYAQDDCIFPYDYVPFEAYAKNRYDKLQQRLTASEAYRVLKSKNYKVYGRSETPDIHIVFPDPVDIMQSLQSIDGDGIMTHSTSSISLRRYSGGFYPSTYDLLTFDCIGLNADPPVYDDLNAINKINGNLRRFSYIDAYQRRFDTTDTGTETIERSQECLFQNTLCPIFIKHDPETRRIDLRDDFRLDFPTFLNNVGIKLPETIEVSGDLSFVTLTADRLIIDYKRIIGETVGKRLIDEFSYDPTFCKRLRDEIYGLYRISSCKFYERVLPIKQDAPLDRFFRPSPVITYETESSLVALGFTSVSTCNIKTDPVEGKTSIASKALSDPLSCFTVSVSLTLL